MVIFSIFLLLACYNSQPEISESTHHLILKNDAMKIFLSKTDGLIDSIVAKNINIMENKCSAIYEKRISASPWTLQSIAEPIIKDNTISIECTGEFGNESAAQRYTIDNTALRWEIAIQCMKKNGYEVAVDLVLPIVACFDNFQPYSYTEPLNTKNLDKMTLRYRENLYLPMISGYTHLYDYGVTAIVPFDLPKPDLQFIIDKQDLTISFSHLCGDFGEVVEAAVYLVPHDGDWRPGLDYVLKKYPEYFYPTNTERITDGFFYLSYPNLQENQISALHDRHVEWVEYTAFFPFYGLYFPKRPHWTISYDSDEISIEQWEAGEGNKRISYRQMRDYIKLWHSYGIKVFLYFQSAEAWHQYVNKYFEDEIATDRRGIPLPSWPYTNVMNSDPSSTWGQHVVDQAHRLLDIFPEIDGVFYDRVDYHDYDFSHNDGITKVDSQSAYSLAFAQEKMNDILYALFHKNDKGVWINIPTSVEVSKGSDGIMAEKNARCLYMLQYLGLVKPLVYLPYDALPNETEEKLQRALVCGAAVSITYGGETSRKLDAKYHPIFELLKKRRWVLNANCLTIQNNLQGNLYQTPDGDYVAVVVSPHKSQIKKHPFEYQIPVRMNIPDAEQINHAYLLSGDWQGVHELKWQRNGSELNIIVPFHLATSVIYLTRKSRYELVLLSPPLLIRGRTNDITFRTTGVSHYDVELKPPMPIVHEERAADIIKYSIEVPGNLTGEQEMALTLNGRICTLSTWIIEPVSLSPQEDIFIHHTQGDYIPFYLVNNLSRHIVVDIKSDFKAPVRTIEIPSPMRLAPLETKSIQVRIDADSSSHAQLTAHIDNADMTWPLTINTTLPFGDNDLFHDDFSRGMDQWQASAGTWNTQEDLVQASGPQHFAYHLNNNWQDYTFEATTRCLGSSTLTVDWLKSYIYFRVQNEENYYRYGIHGDSGTLSLYKRIDGRWVKLHTTPFAPVKDRWYTLKVEVSGSTIRCFIDGKQVITVSDPAFLCGGIGIGVLEDAQRCDYKHIVVKKLRN